MGILQQPNKHCTSTKRSICCEHVVDQCERPSRLPSENAKKVAKRVVDLHEKFSYDPFKRAQHVGANRQSRLAMIRAKAARQKTRAAAAAARRAQGAGTVVEESNEVSTNDVKLETVKSQSVAKTNNSGEN